MDAFCRAFFRVGVADGRITPLRVVQGVGGKGWIMCR